MDLMYQENLLGQYADSGAQLVRETYWPACEVAADADEGVGTYAKKPPMIISAAMITTSWRTVLANAGRVAESPTAGSSRYRLNAPRPINASSPMILRDASLP